MKIVKFLLIAFVGICPLGLHAEAAVSAAVVAPVEIIKETVAKLVEVVSRYPGQSNLTERRAKLREIISPRFDFSEMAKRSVGPEWQNVSADERESFVTIFSDLLAKTYLARVENVQRDTVTVDSQQVNPQEKKALVKTTIRYKGDQFPIDYRLLQTGSGEWRVYDVIIENIGLVANYRNEFAGIIRKEKFAGLMKRLAEKSAT